MTVVPKIVGLSQRVDIVPGRNERRDALDQRWHDFLACCGYIAIPLPNHVVAARSILDIIQPVGVVLTGGNDLVALGGDAPERDACEAMMMDWAIERCAPVLGVCRGLQMIAHAYGGTLRQAQGHAGVRHAVSWGGTRREVNSFHNWALDGAPADFEAIACGEDGSVEGLRHRSKALLGIMWHPEREQPFSVQDIALFQSTFGGKS
jgi:putative glutamine amidotransferase